MQTVFIFLFNMQTWITITTSTLAIILFITILVSFYYHWRQDFNLPLEQKSARSFSRLMGSHTMYILSILTQQGIIQMC